MKTYLAGLILLIAISSESFGQGRNIILGQNNGYPSYLAGTLPKTTAGVYQKLKIEVFGGNYHNNNLGESHYYISTRDGIKINREVHGGSISRYELRIFDNGTSYDFVVKISGDWPSIFVRSWKITGNNLAAELEILDYDTTGKTDITSQVVVNALSSIDNTGSRTFGGAISVNDISDLYLIEGKDSNTGIGFSARAIGVNIQSQTNSSNQVVQRTVWGGVTGASAIYLGGDDVNQGQFGILTSPQYSAAGTVLTERFTVRGDGNVGIGTVTPDSKLSVKGVIHAEEVKVDLNVPGPDYVFEESYPLLSLEDTKAYVDENKHLPGIPSSAEMQQNGVNLLEMNMKLLEKVEELTLHQISLLERLEEQEEIIKKMQAQITPASRNH